MRITVYTAEGVVEDPSTPLAHLLARKDAAIWVDMAGPSEGDVRVLREVFAFHPLAIEDAQKQEQRPKIEEYEGYFFLTIHAARSGAAGGTDVALDEIDLFFGPTYVVSVHRDAAPPLEEARSRLGHAPPRLRRHADYLLYMIVDTAVDSYFPVIDGLDAALEGLEDQLFAHPTAAALDQIFALKRVLLQMRRTASPMRDLFNVLARRDLPFVTERTLVYFRDVYDHLLRITDMIDTHRDLLASSLDLYLSVVSNRLNEVMRRLTVITSLLALSAVITGIYGMNFARAYPSFEWPYGFAFTIAGMMVLAVGLLVLFRRLRWI